tara:strand:- start:994 stop:1620 length:627 start_codon:yes stop_codon:yes gene_type:complete
MNTKNNIVILDYGSGNLKSVMNIFEFLGYRVKISRNLSELNSSSHIILPGVGSYIACAEKLEKNIGIKLLKDQVITKSKPLLGICVGMQILSTFGKEHSKHSGLNFIHGVVDKLKVTNFPLPQIGWNTINIKKQNILLEGIPNNADFYFVHSYKFELENNENVIATTNYEQEFSSIINYKNIYGVQFHPEKSQTYGIKLLKNFVENIK